MASPLRPIFEKRIDDATHRIVEHQVMPWVFLNAGPKFSVRRFDGSEIAFHGVDFEGAPRAAFWDGYITPFLEALVTEEIDHAVALATERKVDLQQLLPEVENLLLSAIRKVLERMAKLDRGMRAEGHPEEVELRSVDAESDRMRDFVARAIAERRSGMAQRGG